MSYTKRQLVEAGFGYIGLAGYIFNLTPNQLQSAARKLDAMMATWNAKGIRVGYAASSDPKTVDLDSDSGIPDAAYETVSANLALRLAPEFGKAVSPEAKSVAHDGYRSLLGKAAMPHEVALTSLPAGQGNKHIDQPFLADPEEPLHAGNDGRLDF
ncbi:MAG: packaged DNA stabilization gp4 family protein [Gallionella sp.]|jgi:hypothetical protein